MKKIITIISILVGINTISAQNQKNTYPLNSIDQLLTEDVKALLDKDLADKKVVFLGESYHNMGSDFLAKTQFVKHLVLNEGYKDIAFEGDFFSLYFSHDKQNLYSFWNSSLQCKELFEFLKAQNVTIWGFDNQMSTKYFYQNFKTKLSGFSNENAISINDDFYNSVETFIQNPLKYKNKSQLISEIDLLLKNDKLTSDLFCKTTLESLKSYAIQTEKPDINITGSVRDNQMAKNLDFLVKSMPEKKFMVWLHNAHMTKDSHTFVPGQNMGGEFVKLNPNISYHIAFSAINTIFRNEKKIEKDSKEETNLLHLLPTTTSNYFVDSRTITNENPEYKSKEFDGLFDLSSKKTKTNWLGHYDALVFISKGEFVTNL